MSEYGPKIKAARLFEKQSGKGNTYFAGRMGGLRVVLLKSNEVGDQGEPIWNLLLSEAPRQTAERGAQRQPTEGQGSAQDQRATGWRDDGASDEIPF